MYQEVIEVQSKYRIFLVQKARYYNRNIQWTVLFYWVKGTVSRDFVHESSSPKPLIIPVAPFRIFFSKIREDKLFNVNNFVLIATIIFVCLFFTGLLWCASVWLQPAPDGESCAAP